MIPQVDDLVADFEIETEPNLTYKMNLDNQGIAKHADNLEAIKQAVYKILNTERYRHVIYSWDYGIELADLFGEPLPYVYPELKRRITEALTWDDRIEDVSDFKFTHKRGEVSVTFQVTTVEGVLQAERTVRIA